MTSSKEAIGNRLEKLFLKHRLVFWYDPKREFEDMFEELELSGIGQGLVRIAVGLEDVTDIIEDLHFER